MNCWVRVLLIVCAGASAPAMAELPLFADDAVMELVIEAPMRTIVRKASSKPKVDGTLQFTGDDGEPVSIGISLTTRGKSRLEYCDFPPLSMNLKRKQTEGTVFAGQNKLKVVTHCKKGGLHTLYLQQEYGIYKAFNVLSEYSFRVRWLNLTYRDTERKNKEETFAAFFIESDNEVAARNGMEKLRPDQIDPMQLEPAHANLYSVFQYLIANTDWSMIKGPAGDGCCHNGKVIISPGSDAGWIVLPYDFDQAGIIDTKYSAPANGLGIKNVRQRLFRGRCMNLGSLDDSIAIFNEKRSEIEAALTSKVDGGRALRSMGAYVDGFYEIVNDPAQKERRVVEECLGKGRTRS